MRWLSRLVTAACAFALVGLAVLWIRSKMPRQEFGGGFETFTLFRDGSRLQVGSPVVIAGVRIGDITHLQVSGPFARVDMRLQDGIVVRADAFATKRADSLFGDSYIEIIPGPDDTATQLKSGEMIAHVEEGSSTDTILRAMGRAMPRIDTAMDTMHDVMITGRKVVNGPFVEKLYAADHWLAEGHIERPLTRADEAMTRVEAATATAARAVAEATPMMRGRLDRFSSGILDARTKLRDTKTALTDGFGRVRSSLEGSDSTIDDITNMMVAINEGHGDDWKGSLGRLVNDNQLAETLDDAAAGGAEAVHGFNRFRAYLGARVELGAISKQFRIYATAEIDARNDKFYLVEFEKSSLGQVPVDTLSEVAGTSDYLRRAEIKEGVRFTGQFGKRVGPLQLRAGVKDSTFGLGADLLIGEGRLKLSADAFGSFFRTPRLKMTAALAVFRSIYILGGVDDALNDPGTLPIRNGNIGVPTDLTEVHYGRDYFLGAAIHFDDADLATLLRVYGALLVGLL